MKLIGEVIYPLLIVIDLLNNVNTRKILTQYRDCLIGGGQGVAAAEK